MNAEIYERFTTLGKVLGETMQPAHISLWLRPEAVTEDERQD